MDNRFGHLDQDNRLIYAADAATVDGVTYMNPSAAMYLRCVPPEKRIYNDPPSEPAPDGKHYESDGWDESDTDIRRRWKLVDNPPPPPVDYSKRALYRVFRERGVWAQVKAWIEQNNCWEDWEYSTTLQSDDELLTAAKTAIQQLLGVTDEEMETILAACEV